MQTYLRLDGAEKIKFNLLALSAMKDWLSSGAGHRALATD
jgi:hypothetical protein